MLAFPSVRSVLANNLIIGMVAEILDNEWVGSDVAYSSARCWIMIANFANSLPRGEFHSRSLVNLCDAWLACFRKVSRVVSPETWFIPRTW